MGASTISGRMRVEWASGQMPLMAAISSDFRKNKPFRGVKIGACLHITAETAVLALALKSGGAKIVLAGSNPLSTQDDVASFLSGNGIKVLSKRGESRAAYSMNIMRMVSEDPDLIVDDGADLITGFHSINPPTFKAFGATEETSTGVTRVKNLAREGPLFFPVVAVNDSLTKHLFDNRYGTGQSVVDGILRATNVLLAGKKFVVSGYGWCGRGIAMRARGMGCNVAVTEISPVRALEAVMDGFQVMPMRKAASWGEVFVTATGNRHVISADDFKCMRDGAIVCNAGHFDVEVDVHALGKMCGKPSEVRPNVLKYSMKGKEIRVISEGRLVNLGAAEGHPASVMDMSFANQALSLEWLSISKGLLKNSVTQVPEGVQKMIASLKLKSMGVRIDSLTKEQESYISGWSEGT